MDAKTYGSSISSTYALIVFGVVFMIGPIVASLVAKLMGDQHWVGHLVILPVSIPLGVYCILSGLKQRRISLALREQYFDYTDKKGNVRRTMYSDVKNLKLQTPSHTLIVDLKDGTSLKLHSIGYKGVVEGFKILESRVSA